MNSLHHIALASIALAATACATARPPPELVAARTAYTAAEINATRAAPTELHNARLALDKAEARFVDKPGTSEVKDLAYIAERRSELASARAATFVSHEQLDASNVKLRSLGAQAATDLKETRQDLTVAERDASAAQRANAGLKSDVNGLKSDLKVSESNATALTDQLAKESTARREAETRLTATLQSMRDLQSVKEETRGLVITLSGAVLFASGQAVLLPAARTALDNVAEALKGSPDRTITVEGHTDSQGTHASNMDLSQRRGDAVRSYLISRGIPDASIQARGFGPDRSIADNGTAEGRANNRRVEIVLAPAPEKR